MSGNWMKGLIGPLTHLIFLLMGQQTWADEPLRTVVQEGHASGITYLAFSYDGGVLVSGASDEKVKLWRIADGSLLRTIDVQRAQNFAVSPDGRILISAGLSNKIEVWDLKDGSQVGMSEDSEAISSIAFSPTGKMFVYCGNEEIKVRNASDGRPIRTFRMKGIYSVRSLAVSPNGKILILAGEMGSNLQLYDIAKGYLRTLEKHKGAVNTVAFSPDGKIVASGGEDNTVCLWYGLDGSFIKTLERCESPVHSVAFSPDGKNLAAGCRDGNVVLFSIPDGSIIRVIEVTKYGIWLPFGFHSMLVTFSPDGKILVTGDQHGKIKFWNVTDGSLIRVLEGYESSVHSIAFSPDKKILASGSSDAVRLWDITEGTIIQTLPILEGSKKCIAFNPSGNMVGIGFRDWNKPSWYSSYYPTGWIDLWNIPDVYLIRRFGAEAGEVNSIAFSPDGKILAAGGCNRTNRTALVRLWDIGDGSLIRKLEPHEETIKSIAFSPDGRFLATIGVKKGSGTTYFWDVSNGSLIWTLERTRGVFFHPVAFSPDGKIFATVGDNVEERSKEISSWNIFSNIFRLKNTDVPKKVSKIKLWNVSDGSLARTLEAPGELIDLLVFSPDGKSLVTGDFFNGTVDLWSTSDGSLKRTFDIYRERWGSPVAFSSDGKLLAIGGYSITLFQEQLGKDIVKLFSLERSSCVLTPEGFFSGTGDFNKYVHFVKGLDVYDFNQFYDAFYRPDLVEKKLKGEDISKYTLGLNIEDAIKNPPPQVTILSPHDGSSSSTRTVTVKVQIKDTGGGIGDIRVHHNGKLVDSLGVYRLAKSEASDKQITLAKADIGSPYKTARGTTLRRVWEDKDKKDIQIVDFTPQKGTVEKTYTITLTKGENTISVSAFNGTNLVMSAMESVKVKADIPEEKPELFVLSIGNNHFANSSKNLTMAVKDANDFTEVVKKSASTLYEEIHVETLTEATKPHVIEKLSSIATQMKPEDVFVFFAATHGWAADDLYYLYTSEFDGNPLNPKSYISSVELMELSKKIPALKQIFILDTCHAGGVETIVTGLYDARISVLAKALGMHIFAGAKTYQEAQDDYQGNGLFTHFILNGLKGEADENHNKEVTVFEMNPYLARTVKDASKGSQEPFIWNFGDDLPLSKLMNR